MQSHRCNRGETKFHALNRRSTVDYTFLPEMLQNIIFSFAIFLRNIDGARIYQPKEVRAGRWTFLWQITEFSENARFPVEIVRK